MFMLALVLSLFAVLSERIFRPCRDRAPRGR